MKKFLILLFLGIVVVGLFYFTDKIVNNVNGNEYGNFAKALDTPCSFQEALDRR